MNHPTYPLQTEERHELEMALVTGCVSMIPLIKDRYARYRDAEFPAGPPNTIMSSTLGWNPRV